MSYVEIKDVVKEYKTGEITIKAADGMNFSFEKGEFVGLRQRWHAATSPIEGRLWHFVKLYLFARGSPRRCPHTAA